jgi:hypothetical protein
MPEYKNPFAAKKSPAVAEMTQKIVRDIQIREQTEQERSKEEKLVPDKSVVKVEKAKKEIERKVSRTTNISIRIKEDNLQRLDQLVYKRGMAEIQEKKRPMKRNGYIELAIEDLLKKEGM